ncbi:MAG: hypothetical protein E6K80_10795 [Candidatus Eisenbacteria bacterium]|uniref:Galactose oxidase n=1 Tax=Eiseniibacteriota bacterium TaxID=2212470 RepID=A0A538U1F3_UNCEI|nr:MAG: hypothetical protein E6K80_10795 [Candidatus Eisenbacteria bacterium]
MAVGLAGVWPRAAWSQPPPLDDHSAIYDPVRQRMIVFGGESGGQSNNATWELSLSSNPHWNPLTPAGSPPSERKGQSVIYDPVRDRIIVFGGVDASGKRNDVWVLSLSGTPTWTHWWTRWCRGCRRTTACDRGGHRRPRCGRREAGARFPLQVDRDSSGIPRSTIRTRIE